MLGEKAHQRRIGLPFDCRCAQFDLKRVAMLANDNIALGIWHDVNPQNCHSPDHIRAGVNLLDGFWRRMRWYAAIKARHFYLVCCVLGLILPYSQFVPWLLEYGLNVALFIHELFVNRISAFFAIDVIVSAIVLIWFIQSEGKRLRGRLLWLPTLGTLLGGISFGFPLFLFPREVARERTTARG